MNLANVIDYDYDRRRYRIDRERATAPRDVSDKPPEVVVREHKAEPKPEAPQVHTVRGALRAGGREIVAVLVQAKRHLSFREIQTALPHLSEHTIQCRLSHMAAMDHIDREGEKYDYTYGLAAGSSLWST